MGRLALALAAVSVVATGLPAPAAGKAPERGLVAIRKVAKHGTFEFSIDVGSDGEQAFLATALVHRTKPGLGRYSGDTWMLDYGAPIALSVYSGGSTTSVCLSPLPCEHSVFSGTGSAYLSGFSFDSWDYGYGPPVLYVAYVGKLADLYFKGNGYRMDRLPPRFTRVLRNGTGTGLSLGEPAVDAYQSVSVTTKAKASVAIGYTLCPGAHVTPANVGAGVLTLTGGWRDDQQICPYSGRQPSELARTPTTWTLNGPAAGLTWGQTRMFVLEL